MIRGTTQLCAVIGDPIAHTASPCMHNEAYRVCGLDWAYVPLHVHPHCLEDAMAGIKACGFRGVNVTVPHKETVMPYLDHIDAYARHIGAVNTVVNQGGQWVAYNTDGLGFVSSLQYEKGEGIFTNKHVVLLGAGGSAKGIAFALLQTQMSRLTLINRTYHGAQCLQTQLNDSRVDSVQWEPLPETILAQCDIVIQTTPVEMTLGQRVLAHYEWIGSHHLCCDIVYKPDMTVFLTHAKKQGASYINGKAMLAGQGVLAFHLMTGHTVDYSVMRGTLG